MRVIVLLLAGWMCGCAAGDGVREAVVRDSAGVRIVENDLTAALPAYVIGEDALVEIGVVEGAEPYLLDNVEAARWLDGGSIAVALGDAAEVRVFDERGGHLRTYGRRGGGPGEYSHPLEVWQFEDSLVVFDYGRITITAISDGSARALGSSELPDARPYYGEAWFGAGAVIMPIQDGQPAQVGSWTDTSVDYARIPLDGSQADTIVRVPSGPVGMVAFLAEAGRQAVLTTPPLFGGRARAAVHDEFLYVGASFHRRIGVYDKAGKHVRDIRWSSPGNAVSAERLEAYIQRLLATSSSPESVRQGVEEMVPADTFPHFDALLTDDEGRLWMRSYDLPGEDSPAHWTVFDTAGIAEAVIEMPRDLTIYEARRDRVLAMRTDSLGVQQVVVLPIRPAN